MMMRVFAKPKACWAVWLFVMLALVATSCGIPTDEVAQQIPKASLPVELVGGPAEAPDEQAESAASRIIWMVDEDDILTPVERAISDTPEAIMDSLLQGTFPVERERGISSAIPRGTGYNSINVGGDGQVAFVDLTAGSLQSLGRVEREVAYAQIVTSLDELTTINSVNFTIDGQFVSVQTSDGATTPGQAVSRSDFASHQRVRVVFDDPADGQTDELPPTAIPDTRSELAVWMFDSNSRLVRVSRLIDRSPEAVLDSVLAGPTIPESEAGITTSLAPDAVRVGLDIDEATGTALVDLTPVSLPPLARDMKLMAVAQIVYSLTELVEITGVVISIDGIRQAMPTDQGIVLAGRVLRREDFVALGPRAVGLAQPDASTTNDNATSDGGTSDDGTSDDGADSSAEGQSEPEDPPANGSESDPEASDEQGPEAPTATPDP